ncbi:hypothetical protein GCM10020331_094200 [Ectobacillus funiculus]
MDTVQIPSVYSEMSTSNILVMEWLEGIRLTNLEALDQLTVSRQELAQGLVKAFLPQWLEPGKFHADPPILEIFLYQRMERLSYWIFGMIGEITKKRMQIIFKF